VKEDIILRGIKNKILTARTRVSGFPSDSSVLNPRSRNIEAVRIMMQWMISQMIGAEPSLEESTVLERVAFPRADL
jgi:hypothetical protein